MLPNLQEVAKGNQIMKFGQLIEYNMENMSREKIIHNIWWISTGKFYVVLFLLYTMLRAIEMYRN